MIRPLDMVIICELIYTNRYDWFDKDLEEFDMMHVWQMQEAKAKFSEMITQCKQIPQIISYRGEETAVVMNIETYHALSGKHTSLVEFLQHSPLYGLSLDLERDSSTLGRTIEL
jgi:prevent-host-death family protein